jgi:hypothetical protein
MTDATAPALAPAGDLLAAPRALGADAGGAGRTFPSFPERPTDPRLISPAATYRQLRALRAPVDPENPFRAGHPLPPAS